MEVRRLLNRAVRGEGASRGEFAHTLDRFYQSLDPRLTPSQTIAYAKVAKVIRTRVAGRLKEC
jgi:hypothetical protein